MRLPLLLCLVLTAAAAADREALTLTDGRTLVGVYDAEAGTVVVDAGKGTAVVKVSADQVAARAPAPPAPAPAIKPAAPAGAKPPDLDQAIAELDKVPSTSMDERAAIARRWAAGADLEAIPVPAIGSDPADRDDNHRNEILKANEILAQLRVGRAGGDVNAWLSAMYWAQQMHDVLDRARAHVASQP